MTSGKLEYYVVEYPLRKTTQLKVRNDKYPNGALVAFWNWTLTGRQGAFVAATRLRDSRQRMADSGKPVQVEAQLLSGPLGDNEKVRVKETVLCEQYAMKLEGK